MRSAEEPGKTETPTPAARAPPTAPLAPWRVSKSFTVRPELTLITVRPEPLRPPLARDVAAQLGRAPRKPALTRRRWRTKATSRKARPTAETARTGGRSPERCPPRSRAVSSHHQRQQRGQSIAM